MHYSSIKDLTMYIKARVGSSCSTGDKNKACFQTNFAKTKCLPLIWLSVTVHFDKCIWMSLIWDNLISSWSLYNQTVELYQVCLIRGHTNWVLQFQDWSHCFRKQSRFRRDIDGCTCQNSLKHVALLLN